MPPVNECLSPFRDTYGFSESKIFKAYVQTARNRKNAFGVTVNFEKEQNEIRRREDYDTELNY